MSRTRSLHNYVVRLIQHRRQDEMAEGHGRMEPFKELSLLWKLTIIQSCNHLSRFNAVNSVIYRTQSLVSTLSL